MAYPTPFRIHFRFRALGTIPRHRTRTSPCTHAPCPTSYTQSHVIAVRRDYPTWHFPPSAITARTGDRLGTCGGGCGVVRGRAKLRGVAWRLLAAYRSAQVADVAGCARGSRVAGDRDVVWELCSGGRGEGVGKRVVGGWSGRVWCLGWCCCEPGGSIRAGI